jgi:phosphoglycerate dehydrogenase-like enzyme
MSTLTIVMAATGFAAIRAHLCAVLPDVGLDLIEPARLRSEGCAADVLIPLLARVDGAFIDAIRGLRLIQQWGVGLEGVDITAATARNIPVARVSSAGTGNAESVAEWCIMAAVAVSRRLPVTERGIRSGGAWGGPMGRALLSRRAGIVGMGGIGQALAARLRPFGMRVMGVGRRADPALAERLGVDWIGALDRLPELLGQSDYLFVCLPLTGETRGLIDAAALALLPQDACVVNASRGGLIDQAALLRALDTGRLIGAGLDVFAQEPIDPASPLLERPDVVATPHIAGVTDASYRGIAQRIAANIGRLQAGERLQDCVNGDALQRHGT